MPHPFQQAAYLTSAADAEGFVDDRGAEIAFAGRSNSGKSSAINVITGQKRLARTSKTPGRTQMVNFFRLDESRRIVDLPGYGYAKVPEKVRRQWRTLMEAYFGRRASLTGLVIVMDVRRPLTEYDAQMLDWAVARECAVHVLLTKADKLSRGAAGNTLLGVRRDLAEVATVQLFSALSRAGVDEARAALAQLLGFDTDCSA